MKLFSENSPASARYAFLLSAVLCLVLAGCASKRTGNETAKLSAHITTAQDSVGRSRAQAKEIVNLVHSASNLQRRIDFKTTRALKLLDR